MYYPLPIDYTKLTAKDRRFQAALLTGFLFVVTVLLLYFFREVLAAGGIFGFLTAGSGVITAVEHRRVCQETGNTK